MIIIADDHKTFLCKKIIVLMSLPDWIYNIYIHKIIGIKSLPDRIYFVRVKFSREFIASVMLPGLIPRRIFNSTV